MASYNEQHHNGTFALPSGVYGIFMYLVCMPVVHAAISSRTLRSRILCIQGDAGLGVRTADGAGFGCW